MATVVGMIYSTNLYISFSFLSWVRTPSENGRQKKDDDRSYNALVFSWTRYQLGGLEIPGFSELRAVYSRRSQTSDQPVQEVHKGQPHGLLCHCSYYYILTIVLLRFFVSDVDTKTKDRKICHELGIFLSIYRIQVLGTINFKFYRAVIHDWKAIVSVWLVFLRSIKKSSESITC